MHLYVIGPAWKYLRNVNSLYWVRYNHGQTTLVFSLAKKCTLEQAQQIINRLDHPTFWKVYKVKDVELSIEVARLRDISND